MTIGGHGVTVVGGRFQDLRGVLTGIPDRKGRPEGPL
jgi:hypothetical protein